jgi:arylsulfatase A-like enzyme
MTLRTIRSSAGPVRPNIVLILTDDLDYAMIADLVGKEVDGTVFMPSIQELLVSRGVNFRSHYVSYSVCCPSRASILRGQYPHNTGILGNAPPLGGFPKFYATGKESSTVATWLQGAGYRTVLIGKYLNRYPETASSTHVPPGWTEWYAHASEPAYYNYTWVENGVAVHHGNSPTDYETDAIAARAAEFIGRTPAPFFMYLAPKAPHVPAIPAPRHQNLFPNVRAPRPPSFNELDVSDKPSWIRSKPLLTTTELEVLAPPEGFQGIDPLYRDRLRSMMAVDDLVATVVNKLAEVHQLENTYIFFTSDNGYHLGEHRLTPTKSTAYEEDIRVPLIVTGPGIVPGERLYLTVNSDLAPTCARLAGTVAPDFVDGCSLVPLFSPVPPMAEEWRAAILVEHYSGADFIPVAYHALRSQTCDYTTTYVEYELPGSGNDNHELYFNGVDRYQLDNSFAAVRCGANPKLAQQDFPVRLLAQLDRLKTSAGEACRKLEQERPSRFLTPVIVTPPHDQVVAAGQCATFSVIAQGANLRYQWQKAPCGGAFTDISGAMYATHRTRLLNTRDSGMRFRCRVFDNVGFVTSNPATVTVQ